MNARPAPRWSLPAQGHAGHAPPGAPRTTTGPGAALARHRTPWTPGHARPVPVRPVCSVRRARALLVFQEVLGLWHQGALGPCAAPRAPRSLPSVTIRWFTDADRRDMRNAQEERRGPETSARLRTIENLQLDPGLRRP